MYHSHIKYKDYWKQPKAKAKALYRNHAELNSPNLMWAEKIPSALFAGDVTLEYLRTRMLSFTAKYLIKAGVTANHVTWAAVVVATCLLTQPVHSVAFFLIVLNLFLDGLDGVVARIRGEDCIAGAWIDIFADTYASLIFIFVSFSYAEVQTLYIVGLLTLYPVQVYLSATKNISIFNKPLSIGLRVFTGVFCLSLLTFVEFSAAGASLKAEIVNFASLGFLVFMAINIGLLVTSLSPHRIQRHDSNL